MQENITVSLIESQSISLFFDTVSLEGTFGRTSDGDKILYNLNLIDKKIYEEYMSMLFKTGKATVFIPTGRFLSIITASLDERVKSMATIDLLNDEDMARMTASLTKGHDKLFMSVFWSVKKNYQRDYYKFILVEDESWELEVKPK